MSVGSWACGHWSPSFLVREGATARPWLRRIELSSDWWDQAADPHTDPSSHYLKKKTKNIQTRPDLSSPLTLRVKPVQETQQRPGTRLDPELEAETGVRAERSAHVLDYILTSFVLPWIEKIQLQFLVTRTTHSSTCFFFFFTHSSTRPVLAAQRTKQQLCTNI